MLESFLFIIFPYAVVILATVVTVQRYFRRGFTYSSLSSQFLESKELFYGSVPWHYGILGVLTGHLLGLLFPRSVLWFNGVPVRLYLLESTGLALGLMCLVGIISLIARRLQSPRIRAVTSPMDVIVLLLLLAQVGLGVFTAIFYRWGSSWYVTLAVPYLQSLFTLQPDVKTLSALPVVVKLHILNAYVLAAVFGFSRLVHMLVVPIHYLWRPYQVVIWNWNRKRARRRGPRPELQPAPDSVPALEPAQKGQPVFTR
jgi:nitrate reductase gamma subunit